MVKALVAYNVGTAKSVINIFSECIDTTLGIKELEIK